MFVSAQTQIAQTRSQWWSNPTTGQKTRYDQWNVDVNQQETILAAANSVAELARGTTLKNAGVTYANKVATATRARDRAQAEHDKEYRDGLIAAKAQQALAEAQAKRILITAEQTAKRDLAINGDQAAYDASMLQARTAYPTALDQSKQSRDALAKNVRDKYADDQAATSKAFDDAMASAEKEYELAESQADATYRKDKTLAKKTRDTAVSGLDASYAVMRDQSWASTVNAAGVLGSDPWSNLVKQEAQANAAKTSALSSSRHTHDSALLSAMSDYESQSLDATIAAITHRATTTATYQSATSTALANYQSGLPTTLGGEGAAGSGSRSELNGSGEFKFGGGASNEEEKEPIGSAGMRSDLDGKSGSQSGAASDTPTRPKPSDIKIVYNLYGIVSQHTPEEWEVINEHQKKMSYGLWFFGSESVYMKSAGFKTGFQKLDENRPPPPPPPPTTPRLPPPILNPPELPVEEGTLSGMSETLVGAFGGTRGDYVDQGFNFAYGVGDNFSMGLSYLIRSSLFDDQADYNSTAYYTGEWVGFAADLLSGGGFFKGGIKSLFSELAESGAKNASKSGFGAKGLYKEPMGMADEAVKAAYLKEVNSLTFRGKLFLHNLLTPFHNRTSISSVREAVEKGAFGRGNFTVKRLDDGRMWFGGSPTTTFMNRQFFHHELIHVSQYVKNPNLWVTFPLRMVHEPIQIWTGHATWGIPTTIFVGWWILKEPKGN